MKNYLYIGKGDSNYKLKRVVKVVARAVYGDDSDKLNEVAITIDLKNKNIYELELNYKSAMKLSQDVDRALLHIEG